MCLQTLKCDDPLRSLGLSVYLGVHVQLVGHCKGLSHSCVAGLKMKSPQYWRRLSIELAGRCKRAFHHGVASPKKVETRRHHHVPKDSEGALFSNETWSIGTLVALKSSSALGLFFFPVSLVIQGRHEVKRVLLHTQPLFSVSNEVTKNTSTDSLQWSEARDSFASIPYVVEPPRGHENDFAILRRLILRMG
jgi:hypothetical protein